MMVLKWWGRFGRDFASSVPLTIVYCSLWTSAYAFSKAERFSRTSATGLCGHFLPSKLKMRSCG